MWLIRRFLKAGVIEAGTHKNSELGTPQGGVISPLLANIYLHYVLDLWFEKKIKPEARGYLQEIRYCDDFVVCCETRKDAEEYLSSLKERLAKFGLAVSPEKTRIVEFGRRVWRKSQETKEKVDTFDFLGFTHYCKASRRGYFIMGHKTIRGTLRRKLKEIKEYIKKVRNFLPLKDWIEIVKAKLNGHFRYFGISGNYRSLQQYYWKVMYLLYKWINRRSQRKSMTPEQFNRYLEYKRVPKPRIYYSLYTSTPMR